MGKLETILLMDAETLAADGHYRVALQRCLTVRRLARHLSEDPELYLLSTGCDQKALRALRDVLGVMSPDADILTWFRGQFAVSEGAAPHFAKELRGLVKAELNHIRTHPLRLARLKNLLIERAEGEQAKENVRDLTDDQFLLRTAEGLQRPIDSIFRIVDSEMTYEQKRAEIQRLVNKVKDADSAEPVTEDIISQDNMRELIDRRYPYQLVHEAHINGIKAALEIYLVVAETGRLPKKLPAHLPKDPFTGRDFGYEITDEGFALRCQGEEFLGRKNQFLEFKVRK